LTSQPDDDHECRWRREAIEAIVERDRLRLEVELLKRQLRGHKSEKMPPLEREVRALSDKDERRADELRKRKERAVAKTQMATETVESRVPPEQRKCPRCGRQDLGAIGDGKPSTVYEYVPGHFRRQIYRRETLACACGDYIVNAPGPERTTDKTRYGAGFVAHLIVSKCGDSIPLYRLEKQYRRVGIPIARSTMTELFHRHAELLEPLSSRLLERVAESEVVQADETSIKMLGTTKRAYVWTFLSGNLIAYRFSASRSGKTPSEILAGTKGTLVVDMYTGYNHITTVGGRERAACLAHARRKFFEAQESAPEAEFALKAIRDVYLVEHEIKARHLEQTETHLNARNELSRPLMVKLRGWLADQEGLHPPKSLMGRAIAYCTKNWTELTRFLDDAKIPPDNNASEAALRAVALGRKNFLFVGHEEAGENIAGLYSLVATCEANGVNPYEYLRDVLLRVSNHPAARVDELLPDQWKPAQNA
jgi:transposase